MNVIEINISLLGAIYGVSLKHLFSPSCSKTPRSCQSRLIFSQSLVDSNFCWAIHVTTSFTVKKMLILKCHNEIPTEFFLSCTNLLTHRLYTKHKESQMQVFSFNDRKFYKL